MRMQAVLVVDALFLAACAQTPAPAPQPERTCAILVGGNGPGFADPKVDQFWFMVNREVTQRLQTRLSERYRAEPLILEPKDRPRTRELIGIEMARYKCNRILQVVHDVNVDAQGPYLRFDLSMMGVTPGRKAEGGTVVTTTGVYEKRYRFQRNMELMQTFSTSAFGDRVFTDLEASGALQGIRR